MHVTQNQKKRKYCFNNPIAAATRNVNHAYLCKAVSPADDECASGRSYYYEAALLMICCLQGLIWLLIH